MLVGVWGLSVMLLCTDSLLCSGCVMLCWMLTDSCKLGLPDRS